MFNTTDVLILIITLKCKEWPLKVCIIKFRLCLFLNEQISWNTSSVISRSVRRELTFLVECQNNWINCKWKGEKTVREIGKGNRRGRKEISHSQDNLNGKVHRDTCKKSRRKICLLKELPYCYHHFTETK